MTQVTRRGFLGGLSALAAAYALDPEFALWVPGRKSIFVLNKAIVQAETMEEALIKGLVAVFPDGERITLTLSNVKGWGPHGLTLEQRYAAEVASIQAMGGRIVSAQTWHNSSEARQPDPRL